METKNLKQLLQPAAKFAGVLGVFGQLNEDTDNGFMGNNLEFVSNFQNSLSIIDEKLGNITTIFKI